MDGREQLLHPSTRSYTAAFAQVRAEGDQNVNRGALRIEDRAIVWVSVEAIQTNFLQHATKLGIMQEYITWQTTAANTLTPNHQAVHPPG